MPQQLCDYSLNTCNLPLILYLPSCIGSKNFVIQTKQNVLCYVSHVRIYRPRKGFPVVGLLTLTLIQCRPGENTFETQTK